LQFRAKKRTIEHTEIPAGCGGIGIGIGTIFQIPAAAFFSFRMRGAEEKKSST